MQRQHSEWWLSRLQLPAARGRQANHCDLQDWAAVDGFGIFTSTGTYYGKINTAHSGEIIGVPNNLDFAPVLQRGLTLKTLLYASGNKSGAWETGLACANTKGTVTDYWNTAITFKSSTTDANKFTWIIPVFITTSTLPSAKPGAKVSDTLHASGGKTPYTWTITKALPSGLKLSTAGVLSGTLAKSMKAGKYAVDVKVTDTSSPTETASSATHSDRHLILRSMHLIP